MVKYISSSLLLLALCASGNAETLSREDVESRLLEQETKFSAMLEALTTSHDAQLDQLGNRHAEEIASLSDKLSNMAKFVDENLSSGAGRVRGQNVRRNLQVTAQKKESGPSGGGSGDSGTSAAVDATATQISALSTTVNTLKGEITSLKELADSLGCISGSSTSSDLIFDGCNVHIRNGLGTTEGSNSAGNLIVGYNECADDCVRTGTTWSLVPTMITPVTEVWSLASRTVSLASTLLFQEA
jgi:hypothetical protein